MKIGIMIDRVGRTIQLWITASTLCFILGAQCNGNELSDRATQGAVDYLKYCTPCHGTSGNGQGPMAKLLDPKPIDHRDNEQMKMLSDDYLFQLIKDGGSSVGKSSMMAPWGDVLSDNQIKGLISYLRRFAKRGP